MMDFSLLAPDQFENLTFDLLQSAGLKNLVWRTPGSDGGRDIEGIYSALDFSQHHHQQRWYVECKRYSSSIDWPTVWNKIAYAECRKADFLLLVTNSNPSPNCETEISNWNAGGNRLLVRVWRGYELLQILSNYPTVAAKYGILGNGKEADLSLQGLMQVAMKLAQSSYVAHEFGVDASKSLEANSALTELISARQSQLKRYGRIVLSTVRSSAFEFPWLSWSGPVDSWDEVGLRAFLTMSRYLFDADKITARSDRKVLTLEFAHSRLELNATSERTIKELSIWADVEVSEISKSKIIVSARTA